MNHQEPDQLAALLLAKRQRLVAHLRRVNLILKLVLLAQLVWIAILYCSQR